MDLTKQIEDEAEWEALKESVQQYGGLMVPVTSGDAPQLFQRVRVRIKRGSKILVSVDAQLVQLSPNGDAAVLVDGDQKNKIAEARYEPAMPTKATTSNAAAPLWVRMKEMSKVEKLQMAKQGNQDARRMILKDSDTSIHIHILNNPRLTANEVASFINAGAASVPFIKAVSERSELMGNQGVVEALVMNPQTSLNMATRLVGRISLGLARRIVKTNAGRAPIVAAARKRVLR